MPKDNLVIITAESEKFFAKCAVSSVRFAPGNGGITTDTPKFDASEAARSERRLIFWD